MKNFINFLPPWVETNLQPAFYEKESGAVIQQTARMYAKVNQLVRIANEQYAKIEEYIAKFVELKDYVEDYFDNLDVQEEINNKLDEMVEDGTLNTIIGSYVDSYISDTNDRLDGMDTTIGGIENDIDAVETNVTKLQSNANGLIGIQKDTAHNKWCLYYSPDSINFNYVADLPSGVGTDASALFEIKGKYYLVGNNRYWITEDFVTWSDMYYIKTGYTYNYIWASAFYYDEDNELLYIYSSYQYNNDTTTSPFGGTCYYFKIGYQTATINDDGTLNIDGTIHDLIYNVGDSYIDPYVAKDPYMGYIIAYKDELAGKVHVAQMNSLTSVSSNDKTCVAFGVEAPQLVTDETGTICYVDGYGIAHSSKTGISSLPVGRGYAYRCSNLGSLYAEKYTGLLPVKTPITYHHMGIMRCSAKALYLVEQLGVKTSLNSTLSGEFYLGDNAVKNVSISSVATPLLVNFPNVQYICPSNKTIILKPELKGEAYRIYAFKNTVITWSNDSAVQSSCKNKTYTVPHDGLIQFYPDGGDILTGTWCPIDRT